MEIPPCLRPRLAAVIAAFAALASVKCLAPLPATAQDPAAERLYREAARLEREGDPRAALEELQLLVQQFPDDRLAPEALLQVVELRRAQGDLAGTRAAIDRLLGDYPRTLEAASAFMLQGELGLELARGVDDLAEARKTFRRVPLLYGVDGYPDLLDRSRARIRTAEIGLRLGEPEAAAAELLPVIEDEPPSLWTGRARLLLATAWVATGEWRAAAELLQRLAMEEDLPTSETGQPPDGSLTTAAATSTSADRDRARDFLSFLHRHRVRPLAGQRRWSSTARFPTSGLTLRAPTGVAAAENGRVLITDRREELVALVASDGRLLRTETVADPARPGWDEDGRPYVVTEEGLVVPFGGPRTRFLEPRSQRENPLDDLRAAEIGPFGDWFLLARGWKGVLAFETPRKGQEILTRDRPDYEDLAQDPRGRIYALDQRAGAVMRIDLDRRWDGIVKQSGAWRKPVAIAVDRLGQLYVLDRGAGTVEVYGTDGSRIATLGPQLGGGIELRDPEDLAVDGLGRIFIADAKLPFVVVLE